MSILRLDNSHDTQLQTFFFRLQTCMKSNEKKCKTNWNFLSFYRRFYQFKIFYRMVSILSLRRCPIYIIIHYWMTVWFCLSIRYRNHFPVVQFQNEAHIRNPQSPAEVLRLFGGLKAPQIFNLKKNALLLFFIFFYRRQRRLFREYI